jgi:hypothetical protein
MECDSRWNREWNWESRVFWTWKRSTSIGQCNSSDLYRPCCMDLKCFVLHIEEVYVVHQFDTCKWSSLRRKCVDSAPVSVETMYSSTSCELWHCLMFSCLYVSELKGKKSEKKNDCELFFKISYFLNFNFQKKINIPPSLLGPIPPRRQFQHFFKDGLTVPVNTPQVVNTGQYWSIEI